MMSAPDDRREFQLQDMIVTSARNTRALLTKAAEAEKIAEAYRAAAKLSALNDVEMQVMYIEAYGRPEQ